MPKLKPQQAVEVDSRRAVLTQKSLKNKRPCPLRLPDGRCCGCCNRAQRVGQLTLLRT